MAAKLQCGEKIGGVTPASDQTQGSLVDSPIIATAVFALLLISQIRSVLHPHPFHVSMQSWLPAQYSVLGVIENFRDLALMVFASMLLLSSGRWMAVNRFETLLWRFFGGLLALFIVLHRVPLKFQPFLYDILMVGEPLYLCMAGVIAGMAWQKKWKTRGGAEAARDVSA
jgi:hypothetical protein